jgi:hypothetical protein
MAKSTQKLKTFRLNESSFERDFPIWIKEAELKNTESLPF